MIGATPREVLRATISPAALAAYTGGGKWHPAPHILNIEDAVLDGIAGRGPRHIMAAMPPRHGKSEYISKHLPAWFEGTYPDWRTILTGYGAGFARTWGGAARRILEQHGDLFGVRVSQESRASDAWQLDGREGGMVATGVGGPVTGRGGHLIIIDDPVKNAAEADSETYRNAVWEWYKSTLYTRLEPGGVLVLVQTRWHEDDLAGRILAHAETTGEPWRVLSYPAIAEPSEGNPDPLGREAGAALWPARYPVSELDRIRMTVGSRWWEALYQQRPSPSEGGQFKRQWFTIGPELDAAPRGAGVKAVRYWDFAATANAGDWSAGALILRDTEQRYWLADVLRGQWSVDERNRIVQQTAELDRSRWRNTVTWFEREGGSGGVEVAELMVKRLSGFNVRADRVTDAKHLRAGPWSAQLEGGNVTLCRAPWNATMIEEHCMFPHGKHDDQVDACSGAFAKLALGPGGGLQAWLDAGAF